MQKNSGIKPDYQKFKIKLKEGSSVKRVIAVMSGKGGVGKSTVTSMLASAAAQRGYKTAIFDADITGPSIPQNFGLTENVTGDKGGINPEISENGIKIISVNLILSDRKKPVIRRGPIVNNVLKQFRSEVKRGEIDYMFVDMPPGTSDVPLTIFQNLPVDAAVCVTTAQSLVSGIVEKALNMADMVAVPVLALVENMSYFECPDCGKKIHVFGEGKTDAIAKEYGIDCVIRLPLQETIAKNSDGGKAAEIKTDIMNDIMDKLEKLK